MSAARRPEISRYTIEVRGANDCAGYKPRLASEPVGSGDKGQSANEPHERAEVQEYRYKSDDRPAHASCFPGHPAQRRDHIALRQNTMNHRHCATNDARQHQNQIAHLHVHTPLYGTIANELPVVNTPVYGNVMNDRLTKIDWLEQGLRTLATTGAGALKVLPMSRALRVSRGSFYWHFKDSADFHAELLRFWQQRSTDQIIQELESEDDARVRLNYLMKRAFNSDHRLDRAVRYWAAENREVARVIASVDAQRVAYLAKLLVAAGVRGRQASARAAFVYWAYLGQAVVMDPRLTTLPPAGIDEIAELLKR
jgi:AcrR family transcriptional regulator